MTRDSFVAAARAQKGVRFQHQGRLPGVGLDCAGLVIVAAKAAGIELKDNTTYGHRPPADLLMSLVLENGMTPVRRVDIRPGDLVVLTFDNNPQHIAIVSEVPEGGSPRIIHANAKMRKVVEHSLVGDWRDRIAHVWRFKEMA